jgi:glycosyltransferase involved in cell wall biosynthesis
VRIAHLDTGRDWRGGQAQILLLMRGLAARGHENRLLAPPGPLLERAREAGIAVAPWRARGEWDLAALLAARATLARFRPDVVHGHSAHAHTLGVPAARLAGVPAVVVSRRVDFAIAGHPGSRLKYALGVDRYLCISSGVLAAMRAGGIPARRLALVPSGIAMPGANGEPAPDLRKLLGIPADAPVVGTVAALAPHKNHADLLRAARLVVDERPEVHFVWLGEGECRAALERDRAALGLVDAVHMPGFRADARALIRQFTVFALASWLEGLCTSLLDAEVRGVPVVATAVGGVPDLIADGVTGRLVAPRDPAALARALLETLADPATARGRAAQARERARAFSSDAMVEGTLAVYREVLAARAAR